MNTFFDKDFIALYVHITHLVRKNITKKIKRQRKDNPAQGNTNKGRIND
jgi:hypothetical protein